MTGRPAAERAASRTRPPGLRARLRSWTESARFRYAILGLIFFNAVTLGLETAPGIVAATGGLLQTVDDVVLTIFVVELAIRIYAHGPAFFRDPWGVFDFVVVGIALAPASESLSALRALRVLRAFRLVSAIPRLRRVVEALLRAVPGIGAVGALLILVFYVFAVIATKLYGATFPDWFGTVGRSMFSLFQIMTLESWSMGIVRPVMATHVHAWAFFVPFIIVSSFTVLNLFIAIIVDSMQTLHTSERERTVTDVTRVVDADAEMLAAEIARLRGEISALRADLDARGR